MRELREVGQDLILAHTARKVGEHVADGDSRPLDNRLSEANFGINDDALAVVHRQILRSPQGRGQDTPTQ